MKNSKKSCRYQVICYLFTSTTRIENGVCQYLCFPVLYHKHDFTFSPTDMSYLSSLSVNISDLPSHIRDSLGALKSSDETIIMVFLLSVLPTFCIKETIHRLFCTVFRENYYIFPIWVFSNLCNSHL